MILMLVFKNEKTFSDRGSGFDGLLTQLVERMTLNHHIVGSIPLPATILDDGSKIASLRRQ